MVFMHLKAAGYVLTGGFSAVDIFSKYSLILSYTKDKERKKEG